VREFFLSFVPLAFPFFPPRRYLSKSLGALLDIARWFAGTCLTACVVSTYVTKARGRPRKGELADMTIHPAADILWKPYRDGPPTGHTADLGDCRIEHRLWHDGQLLTDFALVLQVPVWGADLVEPEGWEDIVRVDCCYQEVHAHRLYAKNPDDVYKVLKPIRTPEDLREGAELAEALIYGDWEEHLGMPVPAAEWS